MNNRLRKASWALAGLALILSCILGYVILDQQQADTGQVDVPLTADTEPVVDFQTVLDQAPFECCLISKEEMMHTWGPQVVVKLETSKDVAKANCTKDDLERFWERIGPDLGNRRVFVYLETPTPGAPPWAIISRLITDFEVAVLFRLTSLNPEIEAWEPEDEAWEVDISIMEYAIDEPPYYFVNAIDRSVDGQQCMIVTLPMVNRISRQLDLLGWGITYRAEDFFKAESDTSGRSLSVTLSPETATISRWGNEDEDISRFLRITQLVGAELGIATSLEEKLDSVIGSPKYYRPAVDGGFAHWTWILNGLEVCYSHSSVLDTLDVTYAEPGRRTPRAAD